LLAANDTIADGRFRIIRQLGRGGMGEVYLASDTKLETLVALKVFLDTASREAQHARRCSGHPHIVTIHDVLEATVRGRPMTVLVMEHVTGRPASHVIDDGPVAIIDAVRWAREVAGAVAHAHDCDVLHCDLKPANVLITPDGAKVVDFGIGRSTFEAQRVRGGLFGTLPYMAPEQLFDREYSRFGDIYSLGVTLFELLTGRLPFEGEGAELVLRIVGAPPPSLREFRRDVPPGLERVVARALAKRPAERYRSARAFEHALDQFAAEYEREGPTQVARPSTRLTYAAAAAALLALVTFAGFVTSTLFEGPLQRTGAFAGGSLLEWPVWGVRALVAAALFTAIAAAVVAGIALPWRLLAAGIGRRSAGSSGAADDAGLLRRLVPSLTARAKLLLVAQAALLIGSGWYFRDIFVGIDSFIGQKSTADLWAIGPQNRARHDAFALILCAQLWVFGTIWFRMFRHAQSSADRPVTKFAIAGLATVGVALFVGHVIPFRIIHHNERERVVYDSHLCYLVGQRESEALLFCPLQLPSWSRVVALSDRALHREGIVENMFSQVARE
jgi:serine/threonine-protein kinase